MRVAIVALSHKPAANPTRFPNLVLLFSDLLYFYSLLYLVRLTLPSYRAVWKSSRVGLTVTMSLHLWKTDRKPKRNRPTKLFFPHPTKHFATLVKIRNNSFSDIV